MANRKLSPSLFSPNSRSSQSGCSKSYLHFIVNVRQKRNRYAFACESQPLLSFGCHGVPARCPVCGAPNPLEKEVLGDPQETSGLGLPMAGKGSGNAPHGFLERV